MHILFVIDSLVPAGAERSLADIAPHYVQRGIRLDVAYLHERPGLHDELRQAGARLFSLAGRGGRLGWTARAASVIRERRPQLVHTTLFEADLSGRVAARLTRTPVVSTITGQKYGPEHFASPDLDPRKLYVAQRLDIATARLTRRIHAVSTVIADSTARRLRYPRGRIDVVPRGRDAERLGCRTAERRERARMSLGIGARIPVVLTVARHDHLKGVDVLIESLPAVTARHPEVRVLVAGREGAQTEALAARARELGLRDVITFLGVRDDVAELMCAADVFVLPSRREGLPGSLLEAMALEVPIVATDIPQLREVVDERCALLVPPERPERLSFAIAAVLDDRDAAQRRAQVARLVFGRRFTIDRIADEMLAFYERSIRASVQAETMLAREAVP